MTRNQDQSRSSPLVKVVLPKQRLLLPHQRKRLQLVVVRRVRRARRGKWRLALMLKVQMIKLKPPQPPPPSPHNNVAHANRHRPLVVSIRNGLGVVLKDEGKGGKEGKGKGK